MNPAADVITAFQILHQNWFAILWNYAFALFGILILFEISILGIRSIANNGGLYDVVCGLGLRFLSLGFFLAVLLFAGEWLPAIINTFSQAGAEAAHMPSLQPDEVFYQGLAIGLKMLGQLTRIGNLANPAGLFAGLIAVFMVIFSFLVIAVQMALALIRSYLLIGGGVVMLGFSGWSGSAHLSERYLWVLAGAGLQLLFLYLLVGAGSHLGPTWADLINDTNSWDFKVPMIVAAGSVLYASVCVSIPHMVGSLITGDNGGSFYDVLRATSMAQQTTNTLQNVVEKLSLNSPKNQNGTTSVSSAARMSVGTGGGGGTPQGAVPKLNSTPARP